MRALSLTGIFLLPLLTLGKDATPPAASQTPLRLEQAQALAHQRYPQILEAEASLKIADAKLQEAWSRFLPKLGVEGGYQQIQAHDVRQNEWVGQAFVEWNLFRGFRDFHERLARESEREAEALRSELVRREVAWKVEELFHQLLFLDESLSLLETSIGFNAQNTAAARKRLGSGVIQETDLKEFEIRGIELASEKEALNGLRMDTSIALGSFLGLEPKPIPVTGDLMPACLEEPLESILRDPDTSSPEIKWLALRYDTAHHLSKTALSPFLPEVSFKTGFGYPEFREFNSPSPIGPQWAIQFLARWELGTGSFAEKDLWNATRMQENAKTERRVLEKKSEIGQLANRIQTVTRRLNLEGDLVSKSERYYQLVEKEYRRGVRNSTDLKSAEKGLLETHLRLAQWKLLVTRHRIDLERAIGRSVKTQECALSPSLIR